MKIPYRIMTVTGTVPGEHWTQYDANKALFEMNESAWLLQNSMVVDTNHDVFPLEPEAKSAWIPVGERLPERETELCSVDVLFTDGEEYHIGYHMQDPPSNQDPNPRQSWWSDLKRSTIPDVTHWQELPALP